MKDNGLVVTIQDDLAKVKVSCLETCDGCAAHNLCIGPSRTKGLLTVENSLKARPGDEVIIDVPEAKYNRALMMLFGSLSAAGLIGMVIGYFVSLCLPLSSSTTSVLGFFLGIGMAAVWLIHYFHNINSKHLYPKIIRISQKGGQNGQTGLH
jgi:positive regulator of sigma E activity